MTNLGKMFRRNPQQKITHLCNSSTTDEINNKKHKVSSQLRKKKIEIRTVITDFYIGS
jgi:hypothetical protein